MKLIFQNAKVICTTVLILTAVSIAKAEQPDDEDSETPAASTVETKIKVDRAPLPVQHTIKQHAGNAEVDLFKQFENGRFIYEARFKKNGLLNELKIGQDGIVLLRREPRTPMVVLNPGKDETELLLQNTPALVQETFREQFGTNHVERVIRRREKNDFVYRATFVREGKSVQINVAENGTLIGPSAKKQIREAAGAEKKSD